MLPCTVFSTENVISVSCIFSEVTSTEQALLDEMTSVIVGYFVPRSRVDPSFEATWAFIATWFEVPGLGLSQSMVSVCFIKISTYVILATLINFRLQ